MSLFHSIARAIAAGFRKDRSAEHTSTVGHTVTAQPSNGLDIATIDRAIRAMMGRRPGLKVNDWGMSPMCRKMVRKNRLRAVRAGR